MADQTAPYVVERLMDMNLRVLARLAEESDGNLLPVTLNIPGTVLYGYLVSGSAWRTRWVARSTLPGSPGWRDSSFWERDHGLRAGSRGRGRRRARP